LCVSNWIQLLRGHSGYLIVTPRMFYETHLTVPRSVTALETRNVFKILVGKPEGRKSLGRPRGRWESNIKVGISEIGCEGVDWINLAQDRDWGRNFVNTTVNLHAP
jgi:hypothetical protein